MEVDCLRDIPDPQMMGFAELTAWIDDSLSIIRANDFSSQSMAGFVPYQLQEEINHVCGAEGSARWRRFFLAVLLADWACYEQPVDRVDYARLKYIMSSAYRYMRLWCCPMGNGQILPVGYSGGYPIAPFLYEKLCNDQTALDDRGVFLPSRFVKPENVQCLYAFNISIVPPLRNTIYSQRVIRAYKKDAAQFKNAQIMAITVDVAGQKLAKFTQLKHIADIEVQGHREGLFAG
ncbi:MAG: hypothetical protein ACOYK8_08845 [Alphaproteobacteria bacterium]